MLRSCLIFGVTVCFLAGCQREPDSRSETDRNAPADGLVERSPSKYDTSNAPVHPDSSTSLTVPKPGTEPADSNSTTRKLQPKPTIDRADAMRRAEDRFRDLDKAVAYLEVNAFDKDLGRPFKDAISRLYDLRNEVALSLAEAETAPDDEFPIVQNDLIKEIEELDRRVKRMSEAIDSVGTDSEHNSQSKRIWL